MTFGEFKKKVAEIQREELVAKHTNPVAYGIERAHFEEMRLQRLIHLSDQADLLTAKRKKQVWLRQLDRMRAVRERFERSREPIASSPTENLTPA